MVSFCSIDGCTNVSMRWCHDKYKLCSKHGRSCQFTSLDKKTEKLTMWDICGKLVNKPAMYCASHKCKVQGCNLPIYFHIGAQVLVKYCISHCYSELYGGYDFAKCCLCDRDMIKNDAGDIMCTILKCSIDACNNIRVKGLKICKLHKCNLCDDKALGYGGICKKHSCKVHNDRKAKIKRMCEECILEKKGEQMKINKTKYKSGKVPLLNYIDE